jgi:mitochondrial fission protein ELM1
MTQAHAPPATAAPLAGLRAWVLTDGKAGDELQCLGLAERLGLSVECRHVAPRWPFTWLTSLALLDPRHRPERPDSPLAPPFPPVVIASGRRTVPYLAAIRRAAPATFTIYLKDPRTGPRTAHLIWTPAHDRLSGPNVVRTELSIHRITPAKLAAARAAPHPTLDALPRPRVAVLVGGPSRRQAFTAADEARFLACLTALARPATGPRPGLMVTLSRRTPPTLAGGIRALVQAEGGFVWDGAGDNPFLALLAKADALVITADSANMISEAAATGTGLYLFRPAAQPARHTRFVEAVMARGIARPFTGSAEPFTYPAEDPTPAVAEAVAEAYARHAGQHHLKEPP